jgi:ankyrin repeat protein
MTNTLYMEAIIRQDSKKVAEILSHEKTSHQKSDYNSLLKDALSSLSTSKEETEIKKIFEISQLLVNAGADVNQIDSITKSPLILSCIYLNNKQAVLFLLKNNVNINYVDPITHWTLLDYIAFLNYLDIAKLFLSESKNDLDLANTMPLVNCIQADNKFNAAMAELLLQHIDVNTFGNHSEPSLFMSIRLENTASLEFLIAHNANVNLKNKLGKSPLACALEMENYEAAKMLVAAGANLFSVPQDLIEKGQKNPSKKAVEFFTYFKKHQEKQINREDGIKKIELSDFQNIPCNSS